MTPNDQRTPAGQIVDGELRVALDLVDIVAQPLGPKGPSIPDAAFAERGKAPTLPGPLLRMRAGTPVRVSVRNTLASRVQLHGLADRVSGDTAVNGLPAFATRDPIFLAPGEEREVRFTPTQAVTSFYYARVVQDSAPPPPPGADGDLLGVLVVDPAGSPPPTNERIFVITLGNSGLKINGLAWPNTERLQYAEGDSVHWRVINATVESHPMHLHGFYFTVNVRGDTQADTLMRGPRPLEVTEGMPEFSTMRLTWKAGRAGNWLFHCHLLVHSTGAPPDSATAAATSGAMGDMPMNDGMAGLIMGINVTPRVAGPIAPPTNARRLDVWTGARPHVFGDSLGLGFVVQRGATPPAPDSISLPSSPLVLVRGEPTRIVVHNRLRVPLSLHWHGMELESYYDGVGHWSGAPGHIRSPIAAGDSMSAYMTPPRAGTFMYHIHGETGNELQQGLYGALVVLERGHALNTDTDRLFVLASRGATPDAHMAINGRAFAPAERFDAGKTYRLRFMHISTNDVKTVRLLKDGKPVRWRPLARDGAALPAQLRAPVDASFRTDVGQTFDFEWTPTASGVYLLEVATVPLLSGPVTQRVAFGVGPVPAADLQLAATGTMLPLADASTISLDKLIGAYRASGDGAELISIWSLRTSLAMTRTVAGVESPPIIMLPLADGTFVPGTDSNGLLKEFVPVVRYRIDGTSVSTGTGAAARVYTRVPSVTLSDTLMARYAGEYESGFSVTLRGGQLLFSGGGTTDVVMKALSPSRFLVDVFGSTFVFEFPQTDGKAQSFTVVGANFTVARRPDRK